VPSGSCGHGSAVAGRARRHLQVRRKKSDDHPLGAGMAARASRIRRRRLPKAARSAGGRGARRDPARRSDETASPSCVPPPNRRRAPGASSSHWPASTQKCPGHSACQQARQYRLGSISSRRAVRASNRPQKPDLKGFPPKCARRNDDNGNKVTQRNCNPPFLKPSVLFQC
jgi:hypothetical protein